MINDFTKKEAPVLSTLGLGGGNAARLFLSGAVLGNRSLRFNDGDSTYLNRTPSSASNRKTWTWSAWVKRGALGIHQYLFSAGSASNYFALSFDNNDKWQVDSYGTGANAFYMHTGDMLFRDTAAWYHLVAVLDTTQSTGTNRFKLYVNGSQVDLTVGTNVPPEDADQLVNSTTEHRIGRIVYGSTTNYFDGYLTDIHFIDGSALTPSSFGSADSNGVWQRSTYSGSYGTNGYHICDFANNSTIGNDTSGQGNNYSANNFSTTAGSGNDVLFDFPTNDTENTDSGAGGEVTGNYACINPLLKPDTQTVTLSNGYLDFSSGAASGQYGTRVCSIPVSSGKWYAEFTVGAVSNGIFFGITNDPMGDSNFIGGHSTSYGYVNNGQKYNNGSGSSYGASFTANDVIGIALDLDNDQVTFFKNGSSQGVAFSSLPSGTYVMGISGTGSATAVCNFGQRPFEYAAPSNFKCLTSFSLPTPTIADGSDYFDTVLYSGDGSSSKTVTGYSFTPDFLWIKERTNNGGDYGHRLMNSVRGADVSLRSNGSNSERDSSSTIGGGVEAFVSGGFRIDQNTSGGSANNNNQNNSTSTYVAWAWLANTADSSNNDGNITSNIRKNTTAGFSIAVYPFDNNNGNQTVGHGLGQIPDLVIRKDTNVGDPWSVYSKAVGFTQRSSLQNTAAWSGTTTFGSASATTSVNRANNMNSGTYIDWSFVSVPGFSKIGTYEGNGDPDGPFVFTDFRVGWLLLKEVTDTGSWIIWDVKRQTFNTQGPYLLADDSAQESTSSLVDFLSNGFKIRTSTGSMNTDGEDYLYYAIAENPLQANGGLAR